MGKTVIILILISLYGLVKSSSAHGSNRHTKQQDTAQVRQIKIEYSETLMPVKSIGSCTIVEKDRSIIKKVILREIHAFWIVYEKDNSLHDFLVEDIDRIEINNSNLAIYFDEGKKPIIKSTKF